jgi:hypothetical protein
VLSAASDCCCEDCNWGTDAACACMDLAGATSMRSSEQRGHASPSSTGKCACAMRSAITTVLHSMNLKLTAMLLLLSCELQAASHSSSSCVAGHRRADLRSPCESTQEPPYAALWPQQRSCHRAQVRHCIQAHTVCALLQLREN